VSNAASGSYSSPGMSILMSYASIRRKCSSGILRHNTHARATADNFPGFGKHFTLLPYFPADSSYFIIFPLFISFPSTNGVSRVMDIYFEGLELNPANIAIASKQMFWPLLCLYMTFSRGHAPWPPWPHHQW